MPSATEKRNGGIVVSALTLRTNLGKILRRLDVEQRSLIIEKRGAPAATLVSIRDYVKHQDNNIFVECRRGACRLSHDRES